MNVKQIICSLIATTTLAVVAQPSTQAYQPLGVITPEQEVVPEGQASKIRGTFTLENVTKYPLIIAASPLKTQAYAFRIEEEKFRLDPGESRTIDFTGAIFQDGKWQINFDLQLLSEQGVLAGRHTVDLYFLVKDGQYQVSNYEALFLSSQVRDEQLGNSFTATVDDGSIRRAPQPDIKQPSMAQLLEMNPEAIFKIPTDTQGEESTNPRLQLERTRPQLDPRPTIRQPVLDAPNRRLLQPLVKSIQDQQRSKQLLAAGTVQAQGRFSWKGMDNLLHPAFGWRVRAWRQQGGNWEKVAEDWIESDGSWQLSFPEDEGKVKFQYIAFNRFFTPQSSSGQTYRWVGPERNSINLNHSEGSWYADTSNGSGSVAGLGEIYNEGMNLWSKLYWTGEINPLRSQSIEVVFPNTTYDCGSGSGNPWSCANTGGKIWLIPAHASRNGVMQHELAHQINYEYWNNSLPAGAGGAHSLGQCYNPGLAIVEGFANFMVFWTQSARDSAPSTGFDFAVENPSFACQDPLNTNESWVAADLWDLHDTRADGDDNLWFIHPGAVPGIYLRSGMKSGMANFHPTYRNSANSSHRTIIDNIFRQDHIIE